MNEQSQLVATLKRWLKRHGVTYRDLAQQLDLSEASVKRMFASQRFTVDRLAQIAALLGGSIAELADEARGNAQLSTLEPAQETLLAGDPRLLLVAVCTLNGWSPAMIVEKYRLTLAECIAYLVRLDQIGLITLLPGNRVKLGVSRDFEWIRGGPIERFFRQEGQTDFLNAPFVDAGESFHFVHGMLNTAAVRELQSELLRLRRRFGELHESSRLNAVQERHGCSVLLACRNDWEPPVFSHLRR